LVDEQPAARERGWGDRLADVVETDGPSEQVAQLNGPDPAVQTVGLEA